jgi:hypothetical protein
VIQDETKLEAEVRRFLLGEMSETERGAFEERFVADEDLFEQVRVGEDELVESYVRGTLSPAQKEKFERSFLTTERRRSRVEFTRTMLDKLAGQTEVAVKQTYAAANPSLRDSIADFFKTPAFAFGAAFALLVLIFGGWFLQRNPQQPEIALHTAPTPAAQTIQPGANENPAANGNVPVKSNENRPEKIPANKNASPNTGGEAPNKNQNSYTQKQTPTRSSPTLALFAGTVRAAGKTSELNLPEDAPGANLQLNLESRDYKVYRVEIVNPDGTRVFQNNNLKVKNSKINFFVPAKKLARGDYLVKLSALNPQNESESVADYALRVNRK